MRDYQDPGLIRTHPPVGSVALKDQNKLPGGVPKNTPFQRSSEAERAEFETGITAPKFRA
jgi:hypothetical protein